MEFSVITEQNLVNFKIKEKKSCRQQYEVIQEEKYIRNDNIVLEKVTHHIVECLR